MDLFQPQNLNSIPTRALTFALNGNNNVFEIAVYQLPSITIIGKAAAVFSTMRMQGSVPVIKVTVAGPAKVLITSDPALQAVNDFKGIMWYNNRWYSVNDSRYEDITGWWFCAVLPNVLEAISPSSGRILAMANVINKKNQEHGTGVVFGINDTIPVTNLYGPENGEDEVEEMEEYNDYISSEDLRD